ncbi:MAG: hypothetical protein HN348_00545 [Proteobacteria bacterium]|nr:hypothetical protein [Pseudomonadota bacterium]
MIRFFARFDSFVALTRPSWVWAGQLAVLIVGIHLTADQLDDHLLGLISTAPINWPDPEMPIGVAVWSAVALELLVVAWAAITLFRTIRAEPISKENWRQTLSIASIVGPLFWIPVSLAGAWVIGMVVEDAISSWIPDYAVYFGWAAAALVAWRLGLSGLIRLVRYRPVRKRWSDGLGWAPALVGFAALAVLYGLPIWGWAV